MRVMTNSIPQTERRRDALSKERIVEAAIEILDSSGESGLTFRALAARLATGSGAIYWHVANKDELLAAATDHIVARVMAEMAKSPGPREAVRTIALGVFDAIDVHPWVGAQMQRAPWHTSMLQIFDSLGRQLEALGVPQAAQFDAATALLSYILGVAGQNASNARMHGQDPDRAGVLAKTAAHWAQLDAEEYPFVTKVAHQMNDHDDTAQFLAGIDLILAGIEALR
ncbi:TetR family transcriptional regulator [Devosia epidermidihirudinis]|uniref:TetR family transcriptional regulator n=2 Tax=Devosia epidermidihirudinis TaxID=1293439 RepID=A0A0F5QLY1_9HYPH|nr:TetR family transcriptional regulator [Devosia epidermidihirudinis]